MRSIRWLLLVFLIVPLFTSCNGDPSKPDEPSPHVPPVVDPLTTLYGNYQTSCFDGGGGNYNQIYAEITTSKQIKVAILTWTNLNCTGTYSLSDTNGNPVSEPPVLNTISLQPVAGTSDDFFVMKFVQVSDSSISYSIFHLDNHHLDVLNTSVTTSPTTWTTWLTEPDVSGFVNDSMNYVPTSGTTNVTHLMSTMGLPNTLEVLFGHWLSDCTNLGGGMVNQLYAEVSSSGIKNAVLTWTASGCSGTYSLTDNAGNPVTAPATTQTVSFENVTGIPDDFFVGKVTEIADTTNIQYAIIDIGVNEFYELVPYSNPHSLWSDWLLEDDVSGFAADPVTFSPMTHIKFHFTSGDLP